MKRCINWFINWFIQWVSRMSWEEKLSFSLGALFGLIVAFYAPVSFILSVVLGIWMYGFSTFVFFIIITGIECLFFTIAKHFKNR